MKILFGIIIGAVLVILAVKGGFIGKQDINQAKNDAANIIQDIKDEAAEIDIIPAIVYAPDTEVSCAVVVESMTEFDTVTFPVTVTGTITPSPTCKWVKFEGQGGTAILKDEDGNLASDMAMLNIAGDWMNTDPFAFSVTLTPTGPMTGDTAYVYFEDANQANPEENPTRAYAFGIKF